MIGQKGILNARDLREFATDILPRFGLSSQGGRLGRHARGGLALTLRDAAQPAPLDVIAVSYLTSGRPGSVRIAPGVIIGGAGFCVPDIGGIAITASPSPVFLNPGVYLLWKLTLTPAVVSSDVTETDLVIGGGNTIDPSSSSQHWIASAVITRAQLVTGDDLDDFAAFDGVGWRDADGVITGTRYFPFAQFVAPDPEQPDRGSYERLDAGGVIIINGAPAADLINTGREPDTTEALYTF